MSRKVTSKKTAKRKAVRKKGPSGIANTMKKMLKPLTRKTRKHVGEEPYYAYYPFF